LARFIKIRNYFVGEGHNPSQPDFKRLMLTIYLAVICIGVAIIYAVLDIVSDIYYSLPAYFVLLITPVIALSLIRRKKYKAAKVLLMVTANLVVFWIAINDPFETGVFLFFVPTGIGSFAMLGFADTKTGMLLSLLTAILFVIAYFSDLTVLRLERPSDLYIKISFLFNYFISLVISVLIVYFQMNLNKMSEDELIEKEAFASMKNQELQKVNEELDRFVYSVSHDLRSPLSSILGLINIARLSNEKEELREILNMIEGRVQAQDNFIREIIDYSRNARTETKHEPIRLHSLAEEIFVSLKYNRHAERLTFRNMVPEKLVITTDRIRLSVILSNLIGNSIKYHDYEKPDPFIEVGVDVAAETIYIQDNGSGMKPEHLDKIFNMFFRASDRSAGSGLGLFITKETVHKLGGAIKVKSVAGEGSIFLVTIPFHRS
jgi:signal transduction histidine kinase